jgi:hypothetical protein
MQTQQRKIYSITMALALGIGLLAAPVQAQSAAPKKPYPVRDHLKCFPVDVEYDPYTYDKYVEVALDTDFSTEYCKVKVDPYSFCAEASKKRYDHKGHGGFGGHDAGNFLCHELKDCYDYPDKWSGKRVKVSDQFGKNFKLKLNDAELLCAPAQKKGKW